MRDQYFKALDIFDSEISRFWTRFNLFTSLQLLIVAGVASNVDSLLQHMKLALLFLVTALVFSTSTILVVFRAMQIANGIWQATIEIEKQNPELILIVDPDS